LGKSTPYLVTRLILKGQENRGERMPLMLRRDTRLPCTHLMEWAFKRRGAKVASNTIEGELRVLNWLEWWIENEGLSMDDPFKFVDSFTPGRIEASLGPWLARDFSDRKVKKLSVTPEVIRRRLDVASAYIDWRLDNAMRELSVRTEFTKIQAMAKIRESILTALAEIAPTQSSSSQKEGLSKSEVVRLLEVIEPKSSQNPWARGESDAALALRARNQLVVHLMLAHGARRGDLLKVCTADVKTHGAEPALWIRRRPDDPNDPRRQEPNAKTCERILPLNPSLTRLVNDYIKDCRSKIPGHKKTPYLLLATGSGQPLAMRSLNDIFEALKPQFPGIHPHQLRHTHNDRLAETCKQMGIGEAEATEHAMYLNGWLGDNSGTYTQRSRREAAHAVSRKVQRELFVPVEDVPT
jgi:integrase